MAKLDKLNFDSTLYEIVPEIAPLFNTSTAYKAGDCVIKDAVLYRFTEDHAAGAWTGTDAEDIEVGKELTGLKQDCNNVPSNKVSVHLSGKRTHDGVVVTTDIGNVKNTFMVLPVQYDVFNLESGVNKLRLFALFTIPEEYLGRCLGAFYLKKYTSEPSEMLTNTTDGIQRGGSANVITNTVTGCLAVNISFTDDDWSGGLIYRSLRLGIEIYTDTTRSTLERVIYSEQFTYKTNSMNPFSAELTNASSSDITDEGAIWGGYLAIPKSKYNNVFGISDFEYLSQIADSKTESGSNPGVVSGLVPYEENKSVVSVLRYGDIYSVSNAISLKPPSKTMTKAVSSGDTFMLDDLWYKATTDLVVGDTLVIGTNCEAVDEPVIDTTQLKQDYSQILNSAYVTETITDAAVASFTDGADNVPVKSLTVDIDPVQDLHGQSSPYPGGGSKNKLNPDLFETFPQTVNGVTVSKNADGTFSFSGTASANTYIPVTDYITLSEYGIFTAGTTYKLSGYHNGYVYCMFGVYGSGTDYRATYSGIDMTFTAEQISSLKYRVALFVNSGTNTNGLTIKPMICLASATDPTTFAPYSNICPISGWTGAKVTRTGKNLYDINYQTAVTSNTYLVLKLKPNTNYVFSTNTEITGLYVEYSDDGSMSNWTELTHVYNATALSFNSGVHEWYRLKTYETGGVQDRTYQLELGSTATAYEPYQGETYSISFPTEAGTVYGGTLDVVNGVLTVTHKHITLNADSLSNNPLSYQRYVMAVNDYKSPSTVVSDSIYSNMLLTSDKASVYQKDYAISGNDEDSTSMILRFDSTIDTLDKAKAFLTANQVEVVYPLATPQTIQLTPTEVTTLLLQNNIFADCGNVAELTYRADLKAYIDSVVS